MIASGARMLRAAMRLIDAVATANTAPIRHNAPPAILELQPRCELKLARCTRGDRLAEELRTERSDVIDVVDVIQNVERVERDGEHACVVRVASKSDLA